MIRPWIIEAEHWIGQKEVPGIKSNLWIARMWSTLKCDWLWKMYGDDSKLAWCGGFCAFSFRDLGIEVPKNFYRAKSWLDWGIKLSQPIEGCVVVFNREGGGHVGFVMGKDFNGRLMVLGGNQGDQVKIAPFDMARVAGYRWPKEVDYTLEQLPIIQRNEASSTNES